MFLCSDVESDLIEGAEIELLSESKGEVVLEGSLLLLVLSPPPSARLEGCTALHTRVSGADCVEAVACS
jgi:hypothetical protein